MMPFLPPIFAKIASGNFRNFQLLAENERLSFLRHLSLKNLRKGIDRGLGSGLGSARRHDGGRPRDRMSIEVLILDESPGDPTRSTF